MLKQITIDISAYPQTAIFAHIADIIAVTVFLQRVINEGAIIFVIGNPVVVTVVDDGPGKQDIAASEAVIGTADIGDRDIIAGDFKRGLDREGVLARSGYRQGVIPPLIGIGVENLHINSRGGLVEEIQ